MRCILFLFIFSTLSTAAQKLDKLTVEKIMRDPKWMGNSPSSPQWSSDSKTLYFDWNPDQQTSDSLYAITLSSLQPVKASVAAKQNLVAGASLVYNKARTAYLYSKDGDIYYTTVKTNITRRITQTADMESNPRFVFNETAVVYNRSQNLFAWTIAAGETIQLTNIKTGESSGTGAGGRNAGAAGGNKQEDWLKKDQLQYMQIVRERKEKAEAKTAYDKAVKPKELRSIAIGDKTLSGLDISPDGRFVSYRLTEAAAAGKATIVPSYVTESGFTTDIPGRTKVGSPQRMTSFYLYDRTLDTVISIAADSIPGIRDLPAYTNDYPKQLEERKKKNAIRPVSGFTPQWSPDGKWLVFDWRADDNKDRWLLLWDTASRKLQLLDRQHDDAWIAGPGISFGSTGWIDNQTYWFQSEATGYSHVYTVNIITGEKKALTAGNYEVQQANLSADKKYFYLITNEVHPGEKQLYRLAIATGKKERLTTMSGAYQATLSPDEKWWAILYSSSTQPWELYLQENRINAVAKQITNKARSDEFNSYPWRDPEVTRIPARDGASIYARMYKPANAKPGAPAVIFVHGAGYLQNAHKWWSSYFREYMFNNLLAENGYYVLDIDYRGSAGYGRDWRTGIYRYMGGKDLDDHEDAARWLVNNFAVDAKRIGIYGGSYGGFITLMGLFTKPGVFAAGAALRPVTDWANYNHGYTANILNEPFNDSIAYRRSSPLYFAEGLQDHLLICHGMIDINVHYQDAVKLAQRLIELGKDNWELAGYPMEDHGFVEPSSWTDEYKRIFKLFETVLKN